MTWPAERPPHNAIAVGCAPSNAWRFVHARIFPSSVFQIFPEVFL